MIRLKLLSTLPRLQAVSLYFAEYDRKEIGYLGNCYDLRELSLGGAETISIQQLDEITRLHELRFLSLSNTSLDGKQLALLSRLKNLRELHLWACGLTDRSLRNLDVSRLERLNIGSNDLTNATIKSLMPCKSLQHLEIVDCPRISKKIVQTFLTQHPQTALFQ